jgi:uncharacterized membrane protein
LADNSIFRTFRKQLTTGILVLLPVITTVFLVSWLFLLLDGILGRHFARLSGEYIHGAGFLGLLLLIWLIGMVSRTYIGGRLNSIKDMMIARIPLVGNMFGAIKQVSDGFLKMDASSFEQVALIEYPRKGLFAVGFVTSGRTVPFRIKGEDSGGKFVHVFVPTVPNPTSGYIILVPEAELYQLKISVEDGLKLVLSLGMIHPDSYDLERMPTARPAQMGPDSLPKTESGGKEEES